MPSISRVTLSSSAASVACFANRMSALVRMACNPFLCWLSCHGKDTDSKACVSPKSVSQGLPYAVTQ
jgi:hypothetical protein